MGQRITTDMVVRVDMFADDVAYTAGLLRAASDAANAAGDSARGQELRSAAREVARSFCDVDVLDIETRSEDLRAIREAMLG